MDPNAGTPHGKQSVLRWDPSSAASLIVLGALAFLIFVNFNFSTSANAQIGRR